MRRGSAGNGIEDGGNLIGLYDAKGGGAISLEPGGNSNFRARRSTTRTRRPRNSIAISPSAGSVAEPLGIGFLALGMSPKWTLAQTPSMPKSRYAIMARYMPKVGTAAST